MSRSPVDPQATLPQAWTGGSPPPEPTGIAIGDTLGPYVVVGFLGRGGFGTVWEVRDQRTGQHAAMKVLASGAGLRALKEEVRRLSALAHPAVVAPFELVAVPGRVGFLMERVVGEPIDAWVAAGEGPEGRVDRLRGAVAQLVEAVGHLHAAGVLHLDIKPSNVLVRGDGSIAVLDFGLAQAMGEARRSGGTPGFIAPEVERREPPGPAADWYAVGAVLARLLRRAEGETAETGAWAALATALQDPDPSRRAGEAAARAGFGLPRWRADPTPPFVGRAAELATLEAPTEADWWTVEGPSGIGKSRLVQAFLARRRAAGAVVLDAAARPVERIPFAVADSLADRLADALIALDGPAREATLGSDGPGLAAAFPALAPAAGVAPEPGEATSRRWLFAAVARVLGRLAARCPVVVEVDDAQWVDRDSAALLAALGAAGPIPGLRVLLTVTPPLGPGWEPLAGAVPAHRQGRLLVGPLAEADARALVDALAGPGIGASRRDERVRLAGGQPWLLHQAALGLRAAEAGPEVTLRDRAAALGGEALRLLQVVCLAAAPLGAAEAAAVAEVGDPRSAVHRLCAAALARVEPGAQGSTLRPYHAAVREALGAETAAAAPLHRRLAAHFEARGGEPAVVAWHLAGAGERAAAVPWSVRAAERAEARRAWNEAARAWADALAWAGADAPDRPRWADRRARCLFLAGRSVEAGRAWAEAAREAPAGLRDRMAEDAASALLLGGEVGPGLDALAGALASRRERPPVRPVLALLDTFWSLLRATWVRAGPPRVLDDGEARAIDLLWSSGRALLTVRPTTALSLLLRSLLAARRAGDAGRVARVSALLGLLFAQFPGLAVVGRRFAERASAHAWASGDPELLAYLDLWAAYAASYAGDLPGMRERAERAHAAFEGRPGGAGAQARADELRTLVRWIEGDIAGAAALASEALGRARELGDLAGEVGARQVVGLAALAAGREDEARAHAEAILGRWAPGEYTVPHFFATLMLALADAHAGRPGDGLARLAADEPAWRGAGGHLIPLWRVDWHFLRARLHLAAGGAAALAEADRAGRRLAGESRRDAKAHGAYLRAAVAWGRTGDAAPVRAAVAAYRAAGLGLHADALEAGLGGARERLVARGASDPDGWARTFMPLPGGPRPGTP